MRLAHFLWSSLLLLATIALEVPSSIRHLQFDSPKESAPAYQPSSQQHPTPILTQQPTPTLTQQQTPMPIQQPTPMPMQQPIQPPISMSTQSFHQTISQQQVVSQPSQQLTQRQASYPSAPPSQPSPQPSQQPSQQPFSSFVSVSSQKLLQQKPLQLPPPPPQKIFQGLSINKDSTNQPLPSQQPSPQQLEQNTLQAGQSLLQPQNSSAIAITQFEKFLLRLKDISGRVKPFASKVKAYIAECKGKLSGENKIQLEQFLEEEVRFHTEVKGFQYDFKHEDELSLVDKMRLEEAAIKLSFALKKIRNRIKSIEGQTGLKKLKHLMKGFFKGKDEAGDEDTEQNNETLNLSQPQQSAPLNQNTLILGVSRQVAASTQVSTATWIPIQTQPMSSLSRNTAPPQTQYKTQQNQPALALATFQSQPMLLQFNNQMAPKAPQHGPLPSVEQSPGAPTAPPPKSAG